METNDKGGSRNIWRAIFIRRKHIAFTEPRGELEERAGSGTGSRRGFMCPCDLNAEGLKELQAQIEERKGKRFLPLPKCNRAGAGSKCTKEIAGIHGRRSMFW